MTQSKLRHFVFTINNPTQSPTQLWDSVKDLANFLIFQKEIGENGTPHFQGYCELIRRTRFSKVKAKFPTAHIEPRKGTQAEAIAYCTKTDTRVDGPFEFGERAVCEPGKRNDIAEFRDAIRSGKRLRELDDDYCEILARHNRYRATVLSYANKPSGFTPVTVELYWGAPGTGKTRKAFDENPDIYIVPISDTLWFDGYDGESTVLIDDFSGWLKLDHLLRLLDGYPKQVPVKGGFVWLVATKIILTSNSHICNWYDWNKHGDVKYRALKRRFSNILEFTDNNSWLTENEPNTVLHGNPSTSISESVNL